MNQLQSMRVFMRVVELSSFSVAARQLGMSAAAVTRSVNMLEAHLNTRLINRSTRSLSLTQAGARYLDSCRAIVANIDEMDANLTRTAHSPHGTVRIAASTTFASTELVALLADYRASEPGVDFDVTTFEAQLDLIEGGFDVGFTDDDRLVGTSVVGRMLMQYRSLLVASPAYLAQRGTPLNPSMLNAHALLGPASGAARAWEFTDAHGAYRVPVRYSLRAGDTAMLRTAALSHMGIALVPAPAVARELASGTLSQVLERFPLNDGARRFSIIYSGRNHLTAKVRAFVEFAVARFRSDERKTSLRAVA
ncbi:LysR family transcriptional regulator [Paraburkholderia humisilvae]|uniref:HTH-type transcriptional regulator DmlR n=1 Tax=Paraburkholderia humisilvae TaxID=627669 RepID=A0A6J5D9K3_9BURK|nr:LysR family transcriptional regulator [Paraburkholderia humisilvae]CAB3750064.1 HTH-type transcriptional regulator DmlR [Paraburkholderia humisilvae]